MMNIYCNFTKRNLCRIFFLLCFLGVAGSMQAQEFLTGLNTNAQIIKIYETQQQRGELPDSKSEKQPLLLPFFEDFSNYTGYPNQNLFMDRQAFVNNTFPVFPPSIGVVTLDALNEKGEIYPHLNTTSKGADTLTSRYIRLDSLFKEDNIKKIMLSDSVYFSFYFQPGGAAVKVGNVEERIGNQPDKNDSLVLEFGYLKVMPDTAYTIWEHIWSTPGFSVSTWNPENPPYQYFKQVLIPIKDPKFLNSHFQFRFRNYASLEPQQGISGWEGNVDQWHIDYIRLDVNRKHDDVFTNDLTFVYPTTSFLKNYQAMPWKQFQAADMKSNFTNYLSNLSNGTRTSTYQYTISKDGNMVYTSPPTGAIDINQYVTHGIQKNEQQASPAINYSLPVLKEPTTFTITHIFKNAAGVDFCAANDTCVFEQIFTDYYAYDDGTAEYGYLLNNQYGIAKLAMKFSLKESDSLYGVRMWFNHTKKDENKQALFSIVVWKDEDGLPGDTLKTIVECSPKLDSLHFLNFVEYKFDKKVPVSGTFWVGFEQQGNVQLNIGFDQNNDSRDFFRYNTNGNWTKSSFRGTPMIRPSFGKLFNVSVPTPEISTIKVYPNPTTGELRVTSYELQVTSIEVFDIFGRKVFEQKSRKAEEQKDNSPLFMEVWQPQADGVVLNISHLSNGIYFLKITTAQGTVTKKVIKN